MAYVPTVWAPGDVIAAAKLNKAEQGIAANSEHEVYIQLVPNNVAQAYEISYPLSDALNALQNRKTLIFFDSTTFEGVTSYFYVVEFSATYICFVNIYNAGGVPPKLNLTGFKWDSNGVSNWPSVT